MATAAGASDHPLIRALQEEAHRFSFFQAVSLIERANPEAVGVGGNGPAAREIIRFRPDVELSFPASSLASVEWMEEADRYCVTATFLGLYGIDSPLPSHWAEEILREYDSDSTVRDFLDIFHHRVYSLFYRTWLKYRYPAQYRAEGRDLFTGRLLSMIGLGSREEWEDTGVPALRLLRYAGLLMQKPRSAVGLEAVLRDWLGGSDVCIESCTGRWMTLSGSDRNRLGQSPCTLGRDLLLGDRLWDASGRFRIEVGPMTFESYLRLLPEGDDHRLLDRLVRFYQTDRLEADLDLRLHGSEVPPLCLNSEDPRRLAWSTWLVSEPSYDRSALFPLGGHP